MSTTTNSPVSLTAPDLDPLEGAFTKLNGLVRKAGARTRKALIGAVDRAPSALTAKDARGFFEHRGHRATAHLL